MTEPTVETLPDPVTKASADLRAIERLALDLPEQAANSSNSRLMPGGPAMALLAHHASLEAWESMQQATERYGRPYTSAEDEDPEEHWDPMQLLLFWSESMRRELGEEYGQTPTLVSEASYLRWRLEWAWDHEPRFTDLAADVRKARVRLENVVHAGSRAERSRVVCDQCDTRLIRVYGETPRDDGYKCPGECKRRFSEDDHARMFGRMLRSEGAEKFVPVTEAVELLKDEGRPSQTIRKWFRDPDTTALGCDLESKRVGVWWPTLWTKHVTAERREPRKRRKAA